MRSQTDGDDFQMGVECPTTSLKEWMQKHDWSSVLGEAS